MNMFCSKCGKKNPEGSKYCQHCGALMDSIAEPKTSTQKKKKNYWILLWNIPATIFVGSVVFLLIYHPLTSMFNSLLSSVTNKSSSTINSLIQTSHKGSFDITQSVIDISCNNNQGGSGTIITESGVVL